jgi:hypothetical protein
MSDDTKKEFEEKVWMAGRKGFSGRQMFVKVRALRGFVYRDFDHNGRNVEPGEELIVSYSFADHFVHARQAEVVERPHAVKIATLDQRILFQTRWLDSLRKERAELSEMQQAELTTPAAAAESSKV